MWLASSKYVGPCILIYVIHLCDNTFCVQEGETIEQIILKFDVQVNVGPSTRMSVAVFLRTCRIYQREGAIDIIYLLIHIIKLANDSVTVRISLIYDCTNAFIAVVMLAGRTRQPQPGQGCPGS